MEQALRRSSVAESWLSLLGQNLRSSEWILIAYFLHTTAMAIVFRLPLEKQALAASLPIFVVALACFESSYSRQWTRVFRNFLPLGFVLAGYWQVNWFLTKPMAELQRVWLSWDSVILNRLGLRGAIESTGVLLPSLLEFCYLILYIVPILCVVSLYAHGCGSRVNCFLQTFLLGTLTAYALLPYFPSLPPRLAFPGLDLPGVTVTLRGVNLWLLNHMDIATSVFPSGHVAAAFSAAFGMWRALPERRWLSGVVVLQASLVLLATVYGRYHYAVDGIASVGISTLAFLVTEAVDRRA